MTGKQRAYVRSFANRLKPTHQIGKNGLTDSCIATIDEQLEANELVKINILNNCEYDKKTIAGELQKILKCEIIQVIGSKIVLYRQSSKEENRKITIPY